MVLRRALLTAGLLAVAVAAPAAASPPYGSAAQNRALGRRAATRLLGELRLPAGAVPSASDPTTGMLGRPGFVTTTQQLADASGWWTVDATPAAVIAFVGAHLPRLKIVGTSSGEGDATWQFPARTGLAERAVAVQTAPLASGITAVRLDGEAVWLLPRPNWERIPVGARTVTFTGRASSAGSPAGRRSTAVTLRGVAVRRLARNLNRLPIFQPGAVFSCPATLEQATLTLRFAGVGGRPLAVAAVGLSGCPSVRLTVGARTGPELMGVESPGELPLDDELVALGAIPTCTAGELDPLPAVPEPPGATSLSFAVRDRSDAICRLRGFPRVALTGAHGTTLRVRDRDEDPGAERRAGISATAILYPGQTAGFTARDRDCAHARAATGARLRLPGIAAPFIVRLARPVRACPGRLTLGSLFSPALAVAPPSTR